MFLLQIVNTYIFTNICQSQFEFHQVLKIERLKKIKLRQHRHTFLSQVIQQRYFFNQYTNSCLRLFSKPSATLCPNHLDADVTYFRTPEIAKTTRQGER
jgi:hypothetical protein